MRATSGKRTKPATLDVLFVVVVVASALPLVSTRYLPLTDLPEHVAAIATIERLLPGGAGAPYTVALGQSQYLAYHLVGAFLTRALGDAVRANQVLLVMVAVAWSVSFRRLLRELRRPAALSLFAPMLFWNRSLVIGFLPFIASVPILLYGLTLSLRNAAEPSLRRAAGVAALAILLFYTHATAYLLLVATLTLMTVAVRYRRPEPFRGILFLGGALALSVIAAAVWWRRGALGTSGAESSIHTGIAPTLRSLPLWTFDIWRSHGDEVCAIAWWVAFAVLAVIGVLSRRSDVESAERRREDLVAAIPFLTALFAFLVMPFRVGSAFYLNVRLAPLVSLFALLLVRPSDRFPKLRTLCMGGVAVATILAAGIATYEIRLTSAEMLGDFDVLLSRMRPGSKVAMVNFQIRSPRVHFFPYVYAGAYHRARYGGIGAWSFSELEHWSVHYAPGARPPRKAGLWIFDPCAFRFQEDGAYYDYVLVQGTRDRLESSPLGRAFVPVGVAGVFGLYEKTGAPSVDEPERGPCSPDDG